MMPSFLRIHASLGLDELTYWRYFLIHPFETKSLYFDSNFRDMYIEFKRSVVLLQLASIFTTNLVVWIWLIATIVTGFLSYDYTFRYHILFQDKWSSQISFPGTFHHHQMLWLLVNDRNLLSRLMPISNTNAFHCVCYLSCVSWNS